MHDTSNLVDETLAFTEDEIEGFIEQVGLPSKCSCADGTLELAMNADGTPSVVALPDPREEHGSNWFFWQVCDCCGQSRFLSAGKIWTWFKDKEQDKQHV